MEINKLIIGLVSIFGTVMIGLLMKIFGDYATGTIIMFVLFVWLVIGIIYFFYWLLVLKKKPIETKEYEIDPVEAYDRAKQDILENEGLILGKKEVHTVKAVGDEKEKDLYLLLIFKDRQLPNIKVAFFWNLKKIHIKGTIIGNSTNKMFNDDAIIQMNSTMIPRKEQASYRKVWRDPSTGEIVREEEGTQLPMTVVQEEQKKGEVEVTEG